MAWTWDEINIAWLGGNLIAPLRDEVLEAFDRVERILGREWIEARKKGTPGTGSTLGIVVMGQRLKSLEGVPHRPVFIEKLKSGDLATYAELTALHLLREGKDFLKAEVVDETSVPPNERVPDLRVTDTTTTTAVEVSRPEVSELYERASELVGGIAMTIQTIPGTFALEVFLRREPSNSETQAIRDQLPALCSRQGQQRVDLPRLAILLLNHTVPGQVVIDDHGEPSVPRIGVAQALLGNGERKHIVVRMPFSDERAERILKREGAQLPEDSPGLVMIDITNAPGGFKSWVPLIMRRFQPSILTRIGAVCLFMSGHRLLPDGKAAVLDEARVLVNVYARHPVPQWIVDQLSKYASTQGISTPTTT